MNTGEDPSGSPDEAQRYLERAHACEEQGEFENALRECELAIRLAPDLADAHNLRGVLLEELGRREEAVAAYREAVRLDPAFDEARENLGEADAELRSQERPPEIEPHSPTEFQSSPPIDTLTLEKGMQVLRANQNPGLGILAGIVAAIVSAALWATITAALNYQIGWMAVGVGFLVGFGVRRFGQGVDAGFGIMGAVLALLGCLAGNLLAACIFVSQQAKVPFLDVAFSLDPVVAIDLLARGFAPIDLLFYGIALYEGYRFSFRRVSRQELVKLAQELPPMNTMNSLRLAHLACLTPLQ